MGKIILLDVHEAAFLEDGGAEVELVRRNDGRVVFAFEDTELARELRTMFVSDGRLQRFCSTLRRLRGRMIDCRDGRYADRSRQ